MSRIHTYRKPISLAMAALAVLMAVTIVHRLQSHVRYRVWLGDERLATASPSTQPTSSQAAPAPPAPPPQVSDALRKRNIFMPPMPTGHGAMLTGVMGRYALFNGRCGPLCICEGASANGITVKSIKDYEVTIEYQGKPETMRLFAPSAMAPPMMPPGAMPPGMMGPPGSAAMHRRAMPMAGPSGVPPMAAMGRMSGPPTVPPVNRTSERCATTQP
jgi:hypothetical protein